MANKYDDREMDSSNDRNWNNAAQSDSEQAANVGGRGKRKRKVLSPDEIDPDWPKRTPDTMGAILAGIACAPRRLLFLRGSHWHVWLDYKTLEWAADSEEAAATRKMLGDQFSPGVIRSHGETDEAIRALYGEAVAFLGKAGVKTQILG